MVAKTQMIVIRDFTLSDAEFVLRLLNEPQYIKNIRDNNVRTIDDAKKYIEEKIFQPIKDLGFGYHVVAFRDTGKPIGMVGLIKRAFLREPDIGFAFLEEFHNRGFGFEAVSAFMLSKEVKSFKILHAFTSLDNPASQKLLLKLGFKDMGTIKYDKTDDDVRLFTLKS